jgi:hypothetical protein
LGGRTFRLVYGDDIVAMVPGEPLHQVGRCLHSQGGVFDPRVLTGNPQLLTQEQWSDDPRFDKTLQNFISTFERDHILNRYWGALRS